MAQQWKPEDEQQFQDLLRRAEQQTRELAKLSPQPPPPAPAVQEPARRAAPAPPAAAGGGPRPPEMCPPRPKSPSLLGLDADTLLLLVLLVFLLKQKADQELIWALIYILVF